MILEIIDRYNEAFDHARAADHAAQLTHAQTRANLLFGDRPLCNVLRPQLLSEREYRRIQAASALVLSALGRVHEASQSDEAVRSALALTDLERAAWEVEPGYVSPVPFARLDSFFDHRSGDLRFVEFNAETPAGVGYEDVLGRMFMELPAVQDLGKRYGLRAVEGSDKVLDTLVGLAREAGIAGPPSIAIVDWHDVPTRPEFEILAQHFRGRGVAAVIGAPDELMYSAGSLTLRDEPVNIVYKRVLVGEFLETCGLDNPLVQALRSSAAVMANPFRCRALHKKASFAVLTDERHQDLFTPVERAAIAAHVPWTRRVEDRYTFKDGVRVNLLEWATANRESLVLKPNDDYGGRGVILGWEADASAFAAALQHGLESPMVIQERVEAVPEPFPVWTAAGLAIEPRLVDLDPYCYHGSEVHGVLTRLSAGGLLNVTAGTGSVAPTFIVAA